MKITICSLFSLMFFLIFNPIISHARDKPQLSGRKCAYELALYYADSNDKNYSIDNFQSDIDQCLSNGGDINYISDENSIFPQYTPIFALFLSWDNPNDLDKAFFILFNKGAKLNYIHPKNGTLIQHIIEHKNYNSHERWSTNLNNTVRIIKSILNLNIIDVNYKTLRDGRTAIFELFDTGGRLFDLSFEYDIIIAKELINHGADIFVKDTNYDYFVHYWYPQITVLYDISIVLDFIYNDLNFPVNAKGNYGKTMLHYAAEKSDISLIKFLIANGADVNALDSAKRTPLHLVGRHELGWATEPLSQNQAIQSAKILVTYGANVNALDKDGNTPIDWFEQIKTSYESQKMIKELLINYMQSLGGI
jgi:hypothetical protein